MLFNPKHAHPSFAGFVGWLETKPADDAYNWRHISECPAAQYAQECCGRPSCYWAGDRQLREISGFVQRSLPNPDSYVGTWGELLEAARKELAREAALT